MVIWARLITQYRGSLVIAQALHGPVTILLRTCCPFLWSLVIILLCFETFGNRIDLFNGKISWSLASLLKLLVLARCSVKAGLQMLIFLL